MVIKLLPNDEYMSTISIISIRHKSGNLGILNGKGEIESRKNKIEE